MGTISTSKARCWTMAQMKQPPCLLGHWRGWRLWEVNKSNQNVIYDDEFTPDLNYTQAGLEKAIKAGEFTFPQCQRRSRVA